MRRIDLFDIVRAQDRILFSQMQIPEYPDAESREKLNNDLNKLEQNLIISGDTASGYLSDIAPVALEKQIQAYIDAFADHPEDLYQEIKDTVTASGKDDFKSYRAVMNIVDGINITNTKTNYTEYLQDVLCYPYFRALAELGLSWDEPIRLIKDHANKIFPVKHHKRTIQDGYLEVSSAPIVAYHVQVLTRLDSIPFGTPGCKLEAWKRLIGNDELLEVHFHDKKRDLTFTLPNPGSINTLKLFIFLLGKVNEQAFDHKHRLISDRITFTIQDLLDIGIYTDARNATRGFHVSAKIIPQIRVNGLEASFDGSFDQQSFEDLPFFRGYKKRKGSSSITFYLETEQNWKPILNFYMILPKWIFSLRAEKTFLLIYEIFIASRRNAHHKKPLKITFRELQKVLNLPDEKNHRNPTDRIINPILRAIEDARIESAKHEPIKIDLYKPENASPAQILDEGYIIVELSENARKRISSRVKAIEESIQQ